MSYLELARIVLCEIEKVISALKLHLIGSAVAESVSISDRVTSTPEAINCCRSKWGETRL